jgi:hypothetical protein
MKRTFYSSCIYAAVFSCAAPVVVGAAEKYLPDEAKFIVTMNVRQLLAAPLVAKNLDSIRSALAKGDELISPQLKKFGLDPTKDIDRVTLAGFSTPNLDRYLLIAHCRFEVATRSARAHAALIEHPDKVAEVKNADHTFYSVAYPDADSRLYVAWLDSATLVVSPSKDLVVHAFAIQSGKTKPSLNSSMGSLVGKIEEQSVISSVGLASEFTDLDIFKNLPALKGAPSAREVQYVTMTVNVDQSIHLGATITLKNKNATEAMAKAITDGMAQVRALLSTAPKDAASIWAMISFWETLKVARQDRTIEVRGEVTENMLGEMEVRIRPGKENDH